MAYWSILVLVLSLSYLAFRHRQELVSQLQRWRKSIGWRDMKHIKDANESPRHPASKANGHLGTPTIQLPADSASDHETTPKAQACSSNVTVPAFYLNEELEPPHEEQSELPGLETVMQSTKVAKDAAKTSTKNTVPNIATVKATKDSTSLMPPPPRPLPKPPPSSASALRVPSTGSLPNRGPPANSQQRASGGLSPNGAISTPNKRGKVLLSPGHSPMDWAALTRKSNLSGVDTFQRVTPSTLRSMTGRKGKPAWSSWQGKVYNMTPYLPFHPGGEAEMMKGAGRDGTKLFMEVHPWVNWENMLESCLVGVLVPEDYGKGEATSSLEALD